MINMLWIGSSDMTGHIVNFVIFNSYYYIIDLFAYVNEYIKYVPIEIGTKSDFLKNRLITGTILKCKSLDSFLNYYITYSRINQKKFVFVKTSQEYIPPIACIKGKKVLYLWKKQPGDLQIKPINYKSSVDVRLVTEDEIL